MLAALRLFTGLSLLAATLAALPGCITVNVTPTAEGQLDQTRAFAYAGPQVWYDYAVTNGRLRYLVIDALPPERQTTPLRSLLNLTGSGPLLLPEAPGVHAPDAAQARAGLVVLRRRNGQITVSCVNPREAGAYLLHHRYQISETAQRRTTGTFTQPRQQTLIRPAPTNDDALGLNLLDTLRASPAFQADAALTTFAHDLMPAATLVSAQEP